MIKKYSIFLNKNSLKSIEGTEINEEERIQIMLIINHFSSYTTLVYSILIVQQNNATKKKILIIVFCVRDHSELLERNSFYCFLMNIFLCANSSFFN